MYPTRSGRPKPEIGKRVINSKGYMSNNDNQAKSISEQEDGFRKGKAELRMELECKLDAFLMALPYEARRDIAVAATGAVHLRDRVEGLVNQAILRLPLKEKINVAEGLEYKVSVKYAGVNIESEEKQ